MFCAAMWGRHLVGDQANFLGCLDQVDNQEIVPHEVRKVVEDDEPREPDETLLGVGTSCAARIRPASSIHCTHGSLRQPNLFERRHRWGTKAKLGVWLQHDPRDFGVASGGETRPEASILSLGRVRRLNANGIH